jgi:chaperonin cofactor prefoldin
MKTNHEILTELENKNEYDDLSANPDDWLIVKAMNEVKKEYTERIEALEKRLDFLEKTNKAFRGNITFDFENLARQISARPNAARPPQEKANEINWTDLARKQKSPYYLAAPNTEHLRTATI